MYRNHVGWWRPVDNEGMVSNIASRNVEVMDDRRTICPISRHIEARKKPAPLTKHQGVPRSASSAPDGLAKSISYSGAYGPLCVLGEQTPKEIRAAVEPPLILDVDQRDGQIFQITPVPGIWTS